MNQTLQDLLDDFDQAAQQWGYAADQLSGRPAIKAERQYISAKNALVAALERIAPRDDWDYLA